MNDFDYFKWILKSNIDKYNDKKVKRDVIDI